MSKQRKSANRVHLTERRIAAAKPGDRAYYLWDEVVQGKGVPGLGLRVLPSGTKTFTLAYRLDGRQHRVSLGVYGQMSLAAGRALAREWWGQIHRGSDPRRPAKPVLPPFGELSDRYLRHIAQKGTPKSYSNVKYLLEQRVPKSWRARNAGDVTFDDVQRLHERLARTTPGTANRTVETLRALYRRAVKHWKMALPNGNPAQGIEKAEEPGRSRALTEAEYARLARVLENSERGDEHPWQIVGLIRLLMFTGARLNELRRLRWAPLDGADLASAWEARCRRELRVDALTDEQRDDFRIDRRTDQPDPFLDYRGGNPLVVVDQHKTRKFIGRKLVFIPDAARPVIDGLPSRGMSAYLFPSPRAITKPVVGIHKVWEQLREDAGLGALPGKPACRLHDFRHSLITLGKRHGIELEDLGLHVGHTTKTMTEGYWAPSEVDRLKMANRIGGLVQLALQ